MLRFKLKELLAEKSFREGRKITLEEVSNVTGVNRTTLSKINNPLGHNTTTNNLDSLCKFFDCQISDLVEYVADKN
ncbi:MULTISPECIES: helix-turn-helix domain-containing protein [Methylicorpusculum]|uniref:helix-turn-helix domain-containing protein n=1 Tax=Methylicorpusculum TaxID=2713642 RepID=UPI0013574E0C|nr:helix-turn-helix transcriptional regulator [Methylicorpusculum sp.]